MTERVVVRGLPELKAALAAVVPKLRRRALRNALAAGARVVRDEARSRVPVLKPTLRAPYRTPGLLRKSLAVRTSKAARARGDVGVYVNVRPAKRGQRGAKSKLDPFYWRFVEFGTRFMRGFEFLQGSSSRLPQALATFTRFIGPAIAKLNNPRGPQP